MSVRTFRDPSSFSVTIKKSSYYKKKKMSISGVIDLYYKELPHLKLSMISRSDETDVEWLARMDRQISEEIEKYYEESADLLSNISKRGNETDVEWLVKIRKHIIIDGIRKSIIQVKDFYKTFQDSGELDVDTHENLNLYLDIKLDMIDRGEDPNISNLELFFLSNPPLYYEWYIKN